MRINFAYFSIKTDVVGTHKNHFENAILMSTNNEVISKNGKYDPPIIIKYAPFLPFWIPDFIHIKGNLVSF